MIGVIVKNEEKEIVKEFFQLFKTPWQFYNPGHSYDVVITTSCNEINSINAKLIITYWSGNKPSITEASSGYGKKDNIKILAVDDIEIPIYGDIDVYEGPGCPFIREQDSLKVVGFKTEESNKKILRIGYDIFSEINYLLTVGQPKEFAHIPTIELHIAILRNSIVKEGIPFIEIPPVPNGYGLIACLTHDVDFISIRRHFLDHSMWGFLYRATWGTLMDFFSKRASLKKLLKNIKAVFKLPFVFLGLCRDPWNQFDNYLKVEGGLPSTFFFIPFKNRPGDGLLKKRKTFRAARYDVDDLDSTVKKLQQHGCEVGVHGIDAWHNSDKGKDELGRLRAISINENIGIRIHWLCHNRKTFSILDQAGYYYDSTFGYNDAVGFKAGTTQCYRPFGSKHLLELPLHIQDTALLRRNRLHDIPTDPMQLCEDIIAMIESYKGVVTILWHQCSLGPERLWGNFYRMLLEMLKSREVWFATAREVVDWFRRRRKFNFENIDSINNGKSLKIKGRGDDAQPPLTLRLYYRRDSNSLETALNEPVNEYFDVPLRNKVEIDITL